LAFVHLGQLLHYGTGGIPKDPQQAFGLFQLTADQGFDKGQCWVGDCYEMGPDGGGVPSRDVEISLLLAPQSGGTG
jgi:TPR repeat protein